MELKARNHSLRIGLAITAAFFIGCNGGGPSGTNVDDGGPKQSMPYDVNLYKLNQMVCDPFNGGGDPSIGGGIQADLYYLSAGQPKYTNVEEYFDNGTLSAQTLFFTEMNVPTRLFNLGFPTETGEIIKNDEGDDLFEYFALKMKTIIKLGPNDDPGLYELALLSDDGSILKLRNENGVYETIVDNDHNHPTKFGCSTNAIELDATSEIPAQMYYYQGPRYHISMIPMWRKIDTAEDAGKDPQCGKKGNRMYFDYDNNSEPQQAYLDLIDRGWKPLNADNYYIPNQALFNPCVVGVAPEITNFAAEEDLDQPGLVRASWNTDIPATSQIRLVNMATGEETVTDSDNLLRTDHVVLIDGLEYNVPYLMQAISISDSYGKSLSDPITFTLE